MISKPRSARYWKIPTTGVASRQPGRRGISTACRKTERARSSIISTLSSSRPVSELRARRPPARAAAERDRLRARQPRRQPDCGRQGGDVRSRRLAGVRQLRRAGDGVAGAIRRSRPRVVGPPRRHGGAGLRHARSGVAVFAERASLDQLDSDPDPRHRRPAPALSAGPQ